MTAESIDRSDRARLVITGPDRAKFLHNLTTNDVKRLAAGSGQETFVTSPQGKTLAYATLLATEEAAWFRTDPGSLDGVLPHLAKYGIFDDVAIDDATGSTFEVHVFGPDADAVAAGLGIGPVPDRPLAHVAGTVEGFEVRAIRESPAGLPGLTLIGPAGAAGAIADRLAGLGVAAADRGRFDRLRIAAGTPISGVDVLPAHLPQEVGRDALTINFVKGCYLGQETVARLDALGHVNKILAGFRVEGPTPALGAALTLDGKGVGTITSAAGPVALGYVRVAQASPGTRLEVGGGAIAEVATLPMAP